jgi:hypothetical protein
MMGGTMKIRNTLYVSLTSAMLLASVSVSACALRAADNQVADYPTGLAMQAMGKQISEATQGKYNIKVYAMPKRWIVERSLAWLEKNRRLWKNCERKLNTRLQFVHLAFLALLLKRS